MVTPVQVFNTLEPLKLKLIDYHGHHRNMGAKFFHGAPAISSELDVLTARGHWPEHAVTMIGKTGLDNIESLLDVIRRQGVDGDILEAGVWRGGSTIFIKQFLQQHRMNKRLFVCDSFEGLPKPQGDRFDVDIERGDTHHLKNSYLGVSLEDVKSNFKQFGTDTDNVIFLKGWFKDTLSNPQIRALALLRADGDMYSSTMDIFGQLFDKVVSNGFIIIDDYGLGCCRAAVHKFFADRDIDIAKYIVMVNHSIGYFRKSDLPAVSSFSLRCHDDVRNDVTEKKEIDQKRVYKTQPDTKTSMTAEHKRRPFAKYPNEIFIESGSLFGEGIAMAMRCGFKRIISFELATEFYDGVKRTYGGYDGVKKKPLIELFHGDTADLFAVVLKTVDKPATFWLDGHFSGGTTGFGKKSSPIIEELTAILNHPIKTHTIIVDDLSLFDKKGNGGRDGYFEVTKKELIDKLMEINPQYTISYENDGHMVVASVPPT